MARHPEGWYLNGMVCWGEELRKSTVLAKGFFVDIPQVIGSDIEAQNRAQDAMRTILITIGEGWSMDWHWTVDGNYRNALDTDEASQNRRSHARLHVPFQSDVYCRGF